MRTAINVVIILLVALGLGLLLRSFGGRGEESLEVRSGEPLMVAEEGDDSHGGDHQPDGTGAGAGNDELAKTGWLTEFELTERSGETVTSRDLRGRPYVASFFFSTCPSVCKLQNEKLQQLQKEFAGEPVRLVAISVDPEVDTPEVLTEYAKRYQADSDQWLFFTGDMTYIRRVGAEMYAVAVDRKFHTEYLILVGADGKVRGYYRWNDRAQFERLKDDIAKLTEVEEESA